MKILHIFKTYLPDTENWIYHLLKNTPDCKHIIYAENILPGAFNEDNFVFYPLAKHLKSHPGNSWSAKFIRKLKKWKNFLLNQSKESYVEHVIALELPDIIHIHFGTVALEYRKLLENISIPFVVSFYGYDYNRNISYKKLLPLSGHYFCEGNAGAQELIWHGFSKKNIHIVPLGIEIQEQIPKNEKNENSLKIVQIASFTAKKGQIYALQALQSIISTCPNIHLTFIGGESPLKDELKFLLNKYQLETYITIKKSILPKNVNDELGKYDLFIHPSIHTPDGDHEGGAPVILLSAQAMGLPVLATVHQDIPAYVKHRKSGILVPEKDVTALANALIEFYHMKPQEFASYGKAGQDHVKSQYNIIENAILLSSEYSSLIGKNP